MTPSLLFELNILLSASDKVIQELLNKGSTGWIDVVRIAEGFKPATQAFRAPFDQYPGYWTLTRHDNAM